MGGHGGLNILPQKRWNVYNFDNREKVRQDEEAAAKEEQLKREQSRKRDAEFRLEQLRTTRGLAPVSEEKEPAAVESNPAVVESNPSVVESRYAAVESKPGHINLFEGIKIFDPIKGLEKEGGDGKDGFKKNKKMKKEEAKPKVVTAEDEKYRLGYGVAGKGVKLPWYLDRLSADANEESAEDDESSRADKEKKNKSGKKTLEEMREERLKREKREKERERALIRNKSRKDGAAFKDRGFSRSSSRIRSLRLVKSDEELGKVASKLPLLESTSNFHC